MEKLFKRSFTAIGHLNLNPSHTVMMTPPFDIPLTVFESITEEPVRNTKLFESFTVARKSTHCHRWVALEHLFFVDRDILYTRVGLYGDEKAAKRFLVDKCLFCVAVRPVLPEDKPVFEHDGHAIDVHIQGFGAQSWHEIDLTSLKQMVIGRILIQTMSACLKRR